MDGEFMGRTLLSKSDDAEIWPKCFVRSLPSRASGSRIADNRISYARQDTRTITVKPDSLQKIVLTADGELILDV